jgi:hypothetical protein
MTAKRAFFVALGSAAFFAFLPGQVAAFFGFGALNLAIGIGVGALLEKGFKP